MSAPAPATTEATIGITGSPLFAITLSNASHNKGIAVSADGTFLAVSNAGKKSIEIFRLPSGEPVRMFGRGGLGPEDFQNPMAICFNPAGNILIAEDFNIRVHEVTIEGLSVRRLGEGAIKEGIHGIAASTSLIAVGKAYGADGPQIITLNPVTGDLVSSFGVKGSEPGWLAGCCGLRFSPDGSLLVIAEYFNRRLSVFTSSGVYQYSVPVPCGGRPTDVELTHSGHFIVSASASSSISVLGPGSKAPLLTFGRNYLSFTFGGGLPPPPALDELAAPTAMALHGGKLFVLDQATARVVVFA